MRASLYARLSRQAEASNLSLDGMVENMRALCQREGFTEVAVHVDDGLSGGYRDRSHFEAWLNDARTGAADVLVNPATDRLTREGLNVAAQILDVVEGKDPATGRPSHRPVRLIDCQGLDSAHGDAFRFRFVIQAEVGRAERERIRQRARDRTKGLRRAGRWGGGTTPFGYTVVDAPDGAGKVLAVDSAEARLITDAASALLRETDPDNLNKIARRWNHAGVKPRRAKQWSRTILFQVLTGDHIQGLTTSGGRPVRDADGNLANVYPEILSPATVTALRQLLAVKNPSPVRRGRHPARLLSGLLTCSGCGRTLQVASRSKGVAVYRCPATSRGFVCPHPVAVSAEPVEEHVAGRYLAAVGHMPMYEERTVVTGLAELATLEADIKDALADMASNADMVTFQRLQELQSRREELAAAEPLRNTELVPTGLTMAETWERAMVDDRRALISSAFEELILKPGRRGPKGFDPGRLTMVWAEEPDAGED